MDNYVLLAVLLTSVYVITADDLDPLTVTVSGDRIGDNVLTIDFSKANSYQFFLKCEGGGGGGGVITYQWHHNGITIPMSDARRKHYGGTLSVTDLRKDDYGDYRCFVTSTGGTTPGTMFSRVVKVEFSYLGGFVLSDGDENTKSVGGELGSFLQLHCPAINPSLGYTTNWGNLIPGVGTYLIPTDNRVTVRPNGNLIFAYFKQEDVDYSVKNMGIRCRIESSNGQFSKFSYKFTLGAVSSTSTEFAAQLVDKLDPTYDVEEGGTLRLWCTAKGRPAPNIVWKKDGNVVKVSDNYEYVMSNHILMLHKVTPSMAGRYSCEASNNNIKDPSYTTVSVKSRPTKWNKRPNKPVDTVPIGGKLQLECNSNGDPAPTYLWYMNGKMVPGLTGGDRFQQSGGILKMTNVVLSDSGVYECKSKNKYGELIATVYINVLAYPPTFENIPFGPFSLFLGETNTLKCEPKAAPPPDKNQKTWYKDGIAITKLNDNRFTKNDDGDLVISSVTENDAGSYKCEAFNSESKGNPPEVASATAYAIVLQPTKIYMQPTNVDSVKGRKVFLICAASSDPTLQHMIRWYKDNIEVQYDDYRVKWVRGLNKLFINPADISDTGRYKCEAYTSYPSQSKDSASAEVIIRGPPEPPSNVVLSGNCNNREATLKWKTNAANYAPILSYIIEYGSKYVADEFFPLMNVTNDGSETALMKDLSAYAFLTFRVIAVNMIGKSAPSAATDPDLCQTPPAAPSIYPRNIRGKPTTANLLDFVWDPFTKLDENGPGCKFTFRYKRADAADWGNGETTDCSVGEYTIKDPGYYQLWQFKIRAKNDQGFGPESGVIESYSGQDKPSGIPTGLVVDDKKPRSVRLNWNTVSARSPGSVDGYKVYFWGSTLNSEDDVEGNQIANKGRVRRSIPGHANTSVLSTPPQVLDGLTPFMKYTLAMTAFNSGGEGPASAEITFETPEDVPGPPRNVIAFPFAYFIMVRWDIPKEVNGKLIGYGLEIDPQSSDGKTKYFVAPNQYEHIFSGLEKTTWYKINIWARTSTGDGVKVATELSTIYPDKPYKPDKPVVEGVSETSINVTFMVGAGGGFPVRFNILYRAKAAKEEDAKEWISLEKQTYLTKSWVEIEELEDRLYEFASIGYNDLGASDPSDITEGRPIKEPLLLARSGAWYEEIWFFVLIVIVALLIVALLLVYIGTRKRGARYPVGKREKDRAGILDEPPPDQDDGGFSNYPLKPPKSPQRSPPPYESEKSLNKSDRDSLDDYGEDEKFDEDGSFIGEYSEDKKKQQDEEVEDDSAFATFV